MVMSHDACCATLSARAQAKQHLPSEVREQPVVLHSMQAGLEIRSSMGSGTGQLQAAWAPLVFKNSRPAHTCAHLRYMSDAKYLPVSA